MLDLVAIADLLDEDWREDLSQPVLNGWLARGPMSAARASASGSCELLSDERYRDDVESELIGQTEVRMHLPCLIGDYTDFYVGIHHATNVGKQFRPDNPLLPNYKYVPIGYHGRASSVRASGEPVIRPNGQRKAPDADAPEYGPSRRLDYELELGIWIGEGNDLGRPIPIGEAAEHIAGYCLLNDWSARDIQAWEYQPLGPFLAKNFLTSVSAVGRQPGSAGAVPQADAAAARRRPRALALSRRCRRPRHGGLAIQLEATLTTERMRAGRRSRRTSCRAARRTRRCTGARRRSSPTTAANGCNLQPGDLIGTGTLSTDSDGGLGSLLEISRGGKQPLELPTGETRSFLEDGDEVTLRAWCEGEGRRAIGFGECVGRVVRAS